MFILGDIFFKVELPFKGSQSKLADLKIIKVPTIKQVFQLSFAPLLILPGDRREKRDDEKGESDVDG